MKRKAPPSFVVVAAVLCFAIALFLVCGSAMFFMEDTAPFYKNAGSEDTDYLPLIWPYRAIRPYDAVLRPIWSIGLWTDADGSKGSSSILFYSQISSVEKIAIENNVIMVYTPDEESVSADDKKNGVNVLHWFVLQPSQKLEAGFETEDEFATYTHTLGIENPPWFDPSAAYQQFEKQFVLTRCMDWMPDCRYWNSEH